jgi:hypothetical protein
MTICSGAAKMTTPRILKLKSQDDEVFRVSIEIARMSKTVANLLEGIYIYVCLIIYRICMYVSHA